MIYVFDEYEAVTDGLLDRAISSLPEDRREKALRYRNRRDRLSCAAVYLLLGIGLEEEYGLGSFEMLTGSSGKPFLKDCGDIFFNLSHCSCACACIISDSECGIDIQDTAKADERLAARVCSEEERELLDRSPDRDGAFTEIWAKKEAYLKMTGSGIVNDLRKTDTVSLRSETVCRSFGKYVIAMACKGNEDPERLLGSVRRVTAAELEAALDD